MTDVITPVYNPNLVLICGKSGTGKSASLRNLRNPEGVMYLNCESGKALPFRAQFMKGRDGRVGLTITDPHQIYEAFDVAETMPQIHTIIVDTLTYLMDMYESLFVLNSSNTMKAWGDFGQYFKKLMQFYVAKSSKNVIFLAHTADKYNEAELVTETSIPIKGATKNNGVESYFSTVIATKKVQLKVLENYKNDLLKITPKEEMLGFKYVFQTQVTKETLNERLRGPMELFTDAQTYMDNDVQMFLDHLHKYNA